MLRSVNPTTQSHHSTPFARIDNMKINFLLFNERIGRVVACMASLSAHWNMVDESPLRPEPRDRQRTEAS